MTLDRKLLQMVVKLTGWGVTLVCFYLIYQIFSENLGNYVFPDLDDYGVLVIIVGLFFCMLGHWILVLSWFYQVKKKTDDFSKVDSFTVIGLSQFVKYLPGNFAHIIGRGYLARKLLSQKDIYLTLLVETFLIAIVAMLLGVSWFFGSLGELMMVVDLNWVVIIVMGGFAVVGLFLLKRLVSYRLDMRLTFLLSGLYFISYIFHGLVIFLVFKYVLLADGIVLWECVAGFALAFVFGYLLPGAPGGIGVREYVFVMLFSAAVGEVVAIQAILIHRLLTVASDILFFILANYSRRFSQLG